MRLHDNRQLFSDAILAAAQERSAGGLGIPPLFIEKDYWICRSLRLLAASDTRRRTVFKGGTSLAKAYGIGARFSEDIDIAIAEGQSLSGNQLKKLINNTAHAMTQGLKEIIVPSKTSKGSHYYKAYYLYPQMVDIAATTAIHSGQLLVEINSFANPYPSEERAVESFLTTFLRQSGHQQIIDEYDMSPFRLMVLDKRRTLVEKIVAIIRSSLADKYYPQLSAKIRHFYDIYYLAQDEAINDYISTPMFAKEFQDLFIHDRETFDKPEGWTERNLRLSPLLTALDTVWEKLEATYLRELSALAYNDIPTPAQIFNALQNILSIIKNIEQR